MISLEIRLVKTQVKLQGISLCLIFSDVPLKQIYIFVIMNFER